MYDPVGNLLAGKPHAEKEHHLCEGGLRGDVVAGEHSGPGQHVAGEITFLMHAAVGALGDVDYHDAAVNCPAYGIAEPGEGRAVAGAVGLEHHTFYAGCLQLLTQRRLGEPRMHIDNQHIGVHPGVHSQRHAVMHPPERFVVKLYRKADFGQRRIIVAFEGVEIVGAHLRGPVSAPQIVLEEDGNLLHHRLAVDGVALGGNLKGCDKILLAVGAHLAYGELGAGDNHRLVEMLEHE